MTITVDQLVARDVHYCVSALVYQLAGAYGELDGAAGASGRDVANLTEQAANLASPIDDWEEAAREAGWSEAGEGPLDSDFVHPDSDAVYNNWQTLCETEGLEPYQREVYEHWIVSDWLADKLIERGEKVDKDFAGLTVWARTTTGQNIALDGVIVDIHAALTA